MDEPIPFTITRALIQLHSVPFALLLEDGIGYVPLQVVSESSSEEVRAAVDSLREEGIRGLILDLRGNPGGLLDQGVAVSDLFLPAGKPIVEIRGRVPSQNQTFSAFDEEAYPGLPVVVLVDERSASASEIIAGALQDHDRALVLGARTFGKGSVQTLFRLTGGNVLRLTTARWYTPSGRSIQKARDEQLGAFERGVLTLSGHVAVRPDTVERPTFTSVGGRTLVGGGGITPDILVVPDTLTVEEQRAIRELDRAGGSFATAVFNYAVFYLQEHPSLAPGFRLGEADLETFRRRLPEWDVEISADAFRALRRFIRFQLTREIAQQAWGAEGEFRALLPHDRAVERALELLREAGSPEDLFRLAGQDVGTLVSGGAPEGDDGGDAPGASPS